MEKREYIVVGTINITSDEVYEYLSYRNKNNFIRIKRNIYINRTRLERLQKISIITVIQKYTIL